MIRISLDIDHYRRKKNDEECSVDVRVTVNRKAYYISTGVRVRKDRLIGNTIRDVKVKGEDGIVRMTDDADVLNERLATIVRLVEQEVNKCLDERRPLDVVAIRKSIWAVGESSCDDEEEPTLIAWIREQVPMLNVTKATKMRYITLCNRLTEYGKITRWEHLTIENIYRFDAWLHAMDVHLTENQREAGVEPRKLGDTAVYSYHKSLQAMLNRAMKIGKITANPYDRMRGEFRRGAREAIDYLTDEQMKKILELTPVPGSQVAMARDLFIFQAYTGLSYSDTQIFDIKQYKREVVDGIDGQKTEQWRYMGERVKTGVPYVSMLLPPVVEVLKRNGWRVPRMNNQRYNQMLKAIGMCIGIEKLHSHMGRHTFATWMLSNGAKIENVSRMLGHTNITQTQRYAKVLAKDVYEDFEKIAAKMGR